MMRRPILFLLAGLLWAGVASAQTTINPTKVEFDSPDHNTTCPADACVGGYRIEIWLPNVDPATGAPVSQATVAKTVVVPTGASPAYRIDKANWGVTTTPGTTYVMRLVAIGQDTSVTSARSAPSNPFVRSAVAPNAPLALIVR